MDSTGQALIWVRAGSISQPVLESWVPAGQTIHQALETLGIKLPQAAIALVNGKPCDLNTVLQPGDQVRFLYQINGG